MKRQTRNNIIKTIRTLILLAGMIAGGGMAWGQEGEGNENTEITINPNPASKDSMVIYVKEGETKDIIIQSKCNQTLDGYIFIHGDEDILNNISFGSKYQNGYYWYNNDITDKQVDDAACKFKILELDAGTLQGDKKIILDASSVMSYGEIDLGKIGLSLRRTYFIRNARERADALKKKQEAVEDNELWRKWVEDVEEDLPQLKGDLSPFFTEQVEIHTPIINGNGNDMPGTHFRLGDKVHNFYIYDQDNNIQNVRGVRWRVYNEKGENVTEEGEYWGAFEKDNKGEVNYSNNYYTLIKQSQNITDFAKFASIFSYRFKEQKSSSRDVEAKTCKYYITAELGYWEGDNIDNAIWYPYAFRTVYLEPYQEPLTQKGIEDKLGTDDKIHYQIRNREYLMANYELVAFEAFDTQLDATEEGGRKSLLIDRDELKTKNNFKQGSLPRLTPTYAFAWPSYHDSITMDGKRRRRNYSVGRGEYALYRTLNVEGVSTSKEDYGDYFANNDGNYKVSVYDRYYDISGYKQHGFFLYVDAADEAGKITDLSFSDELCPNTRIFVTAWICNLRHNGGGNPTPANADVGFTFRGRNKDENGNLKENDILYKYYTGTIPQSTSYSESSGKDQADWQQVSFSFIVGDAKYDEYVLEILNNCVHSNAADYAIDDIRIYRSRPTVSVERCDHCDADTLKFSMPYVSMLDNMGWTEDEPISLEHVRDSVKLFVRYRLGLHGPDPESTFNTGVDEGINTEQNYTGNIYLGVVDGLDPGNADQKDVTYQPDKVAGQDGYKWVNINKKVGNPILSKVIRCIISSNLNATSPNYPDEVGRLYPRTMEASDYIDTLFNYRALKDYNFIVSKGEKLIKQLLPDSLPGSDKLIQHTEISLEKLGIKETKTGSITEDISQVNPAVYDSLVHVLFAERLGIPPVHCGWFDRKQGRIYLQNLLVSNTDMKYKGEIQLGEKGMPAKTYGGDYVRASGEYHAMLYTATEIAKNETDPHDPCALKNEFTVLRSVEVFVNPETEYNSLFCNEQLRKISAHLNPGILDPELDPLGKDDYAFDCFIGSREEYGRQTTEGKDLLEQIRIFRDNNELYGPLTIQDINKAKSDTDIGEKLKSLIEDEKLQTGDTVFTIILQKQIVLMPYIKNRKDFNEVKRGIYCLKATDLDFDNLEDSPSLAPGLPTVNYPELVPATPVRLGLRHLQGQPLTIPLRKEVTSGWNNKFKEDEGEQHPEFALKEDSQRDSIYVLSNSQLTEVGRVRKLSAQSGKADNLLVMELKQGENGFSFEEGREYTLYIPFAEYASMEEPNPIQGSCDGLGLLPVKIVPEYLTWKGEKTAVWYNDRNWSQSTKGELYVGDKAYTDNEDAGNEDANGSDNVENAFTPLYFTKITIPAGKTLELDGLAYESGSLVGLKEGKTPDIQYDMAIDTVIDAEADARYKVGPYYINKVSEIYFKPAARLRRQQYLAYDTARVEFEMEKNGKYWLSSPLQEVFAGDMYAPKNLGRQTTFAFDPIFYSADKNDRQAPAFYQKAWDKGVTVYAPQEGRTGNLSQGDLTGNEYKVVRSNWSVEYNDVDVPYALGKGFYASVEDFNNDKALVRLPKADKNYLYEPQKTATKASTIGTRRDSVGRLAGSGPVSVVLSDADAKGAWWRGDGAVADGDGTHFLLGNPYMYPLDIKKFLEANAAVLSPKYWTLSGDGSTSVVGTPDVEWSDGGAETEGQTAERQTIAPMQAFFVELKETVGGTARSQGDTTVVFRPEMMLGETGAESRQFLRSAVTATHPVIRLTATKGDKRSIAYLTQRDDASDAYESDKDAVTLLDSELTEIPQVYTVAGNRTAGVNAVKRIDNIPLGVYAASGKEEVSLTIEGFGSLPGTLYLYDAQSRTSKPLAGDRYTWLVDGSSHGRYFLRSSEKPTGNEAVFAPAISIYSAVAGKVVVSATEPLKQVQVFTPAGTLVRNLLPGQQVCTLSLPQGVYFVRAVTAGTGKAEKLRVR